MTQAEVTITRHGTDDGSGQRGEYHAHVPGAAAIGRLTWVRRDDSHGVVRVADHTLVPGEIGGRGVAARLVDALIADARAQHFRIEPACSYVAAAFDRHPEWAALRTG